MSQFHPFFFRFCPQVGIAFAAPVSTPAGRLKARRELKDWEDASRETMNRATLPRRFTFFQ
jgi:hypothetical protein